MHTFFTLFCVFCQLHTGRLLPNAWPSEEMIRSSTYLQNAIAKPVYYYAYILLAISPIHILGLLIASASICRIIFEIVKTKKVVREYTYLVFILWPAAFIAGLTLLGFKGAGYQSRFLLPIIPATSILCAVQIVT